MHKKKSSRFWRIREARGFAKFGFDREESEEEFKARSPSFPTPDTDGEYPLHGFDLDYVTEQLSKYSLGEKLSNRTFMDQIVWGKNIGAVRLNFGTVNDIMIERLLSDLEGNPIWVTKKLIGLNRAEYSDREDTVVEELLKELKVVNDSPLDSAMSEFENFERLVTAAAYRTGTVVNDPLFIDSIVKVNERRYIINFGLRGFGQGAPDQSRVNQVMVDLSFDPKKGIVKMIEGNVESRHTKGMEWNLVPSDFIFYFMPSQSQDEIVNIIATMMKYF